MSMCTSYRHWVHMAIVYQTVSAILQYKCIHSVPVQDIERRRSLVAVVAMQINKSISVGGISCIQHSCSVCVCYCVLVAYSQSSPKWITWDGIAMMMMMMIRRWMIMGNHCNISYCPLKLSSIYSPTYSILITLYAHKTYFSFSTYFSVCVFTLVISFKSSYNQIYFLLSRIFLNITL